MSYSGLFRDGVQFCSGLVDLVVCVGRHGGGGHRFPLAGERLVGLVAEDIAEVGDGGADFRRSRGSEVVEREPGDGGRGLMASDPVQEDGEHSKGAANHGGVTGVVVVADRQSDVIERGQRVAAFGLESGQG